MAPTESENKFEIGAMKIALLPPPSDKRKATSIVVESLCVLRQSVSKWHSSAFEHVLPKVGEIGARYACVVTMRLRRDDGVIRAELVEPRKIELSLPHITTWRANGLGWLTQFDNCCETERANPTPWLGRACTCDVSERTRASG